MAQSTRDSFGCPSPFSISVSVGHTRTHTHTSSLDLSLLIRRVLHPKSAAPWVTCIDLIHLFASRTRIRIWTPARAPLPESHSLWPIRFLCLRPRKEKSFNLISCSDAGDIYQIKNLPFSTWPVGGNGTRLRTPAVRCEKSHRYLRQFILFNSHGLT